MTLNIVVMTSLWLPQR